MTRAVAARTARPWWLLDRRPAHSVIALLPAHCRVAECALVLVSPPGEHVVAQKGGRCPATVEPSSWHEWSKRSLAMMWL
jgi:hypothetical protein